MRGLTIIRKAVVHLSPEQWGLYSDMPGVKSVASLLNYQFSLWLNIYSEKEFPEAEAEELLKKWKQFGSWDTAVRVTAYELMNAFYHPEV